ncbi:MAG: class I SAM-dependent methyltransferase [Patescibacteria group bacterium]|jgi:2-polyprenyl-3-methyl-5-hydroxy-6-metoxy-1,4-benzoquinol methylase
MGNNIQNQKCVASSKYWNDHWPEKKFSIASSRHPIRRWIESEVRATTKADVFEIGCYPGKFLAVFGELGYTLNGIDSFSKTNPAMSDWLKNEGYKIGQFYQSDFLNFSSKQQYDIVCSFGFIEHFKNWEEVLINHIRLTKDGGHIIIDVPNLKSPLYYFLYKIFEPEVLKNHEFSAMNKETIKTVFRNNGCTVEAAMYLSRFHFRFVTKQSWPFTVIEKCINSFGLLLELLPKSIYARYIAVSAIKELSNR